MDDENIDLIEKLLNEKSNAESDSLLKLVEDNGGPKLFSSKLRARVDVDWKLLVRQSKEKAASVVAGIESKSKERGLVMDEKVRKHVGHLSLREAVARQLKALVDSRASASVVETASPYMQGARFQQLQGEHLSTLSSSRGVACIAPYLSYEWEALAVLDAERAQQAGMIKHSKFMVLDSGEDKFRFPALFSILELMAAIPRELNLKLRTSFSELSNQLYLCQESVPLPKRRVGGIMLSYHFSRTTTKSIVNLLEGELSYPFERNSMCAIRMESGKDYEVHLNPQTGSNWMIFAISDLAG